MSDMNQIPLFETEPEAKGVKPQDTKTCIRCGILCRVATRQNPHAQVFVRGDKRTGRFCTECLVVDFFKNFDLGPVSALGSDFMNALDPEMLRAPHLQQQFFRILKAAQETYGAELGFDEIDWERVIVNWHLPFPKEKRKPG